MSTDYYVYALLRQNSVPFYIGFGRAYRWKQHEKRARSERSHKAHIIRQLQRAGLEVPKVKLEENLTRDQAIKLEIHLIKMLGREPNGPLTNLTAGGEGVPQSNPSEETRGKMRAAALGKSRLFTAEHRERLSRAAKLRIVRNPAEWEATQRKSSGGSKPESREKNRIAHLGKTPSLETIEKRRAKMLGHEVSIATREKLRQKLAGRPRPESRGRPVSQETRHKISVGQAAAWQRGRKCRQA